MEHTADLARLRAVLQREHTEQASKMHEKFNEAHSRYAGDIAHINERQQARVSNAIASVHLEYAATLGVLRGLATVAGHENSNKDFDVDPSSCMPSLLARMLEIWRADSSRHQEIETIKAQLAALPRLGTYFRAYPLY